MKEKILVADDDKKLCKIYGLYLENEGYDVTLANDGADAEKIIENEVFDLIVLDVMMPKKDGWSLLRKIKQKGNTPVIITSSRGDEEDRIFGLELGADDYMVKPVSLKEMMLRVSLRIRKEAPKKEIISVKIGDIEINQEKREVIENNKEISLTPKEFDLLVYLIKNSDVVLKRNTLLESVWGYKFSGDTRTVDTHIKNLREKIKYCEKNLKTVWGVGYKLEYEK